MRPPVGSTTGDEVDDRCILREPDGVVERRKGCPFRSAASRFFSPVRRRTGARRGVPVLDEVVFTDPRLRESALLEERAQVDQFLVSLSRRLVGVCRYLADE